MKQILFIAFLLSIPHFIKGSPNWVEPDGSSMDATQLILRKQIMESEKKPIPREPASTSQKKTSSSTCGKNTEGRGDKSSCSDAVDSTKKTSDTK
ncbi:MAG: hypothetical protein KUL82_03860 [Bdellovibrio sp.]|nr:hypothetical protein [Bdellovibrio sp.]